jgi:hypothetical protein
MFYNIYAWNRFRDYCLGLGAAEVEAEDFEIDTSSPQASPHGDLHRAAGDGRLLQGAGRC